MSEPKKKYLVVDSVYMKAEDYTPEIGEVVELEPFRGEAVEKLGHLRSLTDKQAKAYAEMIEEHESNIANAEALEIAQGRVAALRTEDVRWAEVWSTWKTGDGLDVLLASHKKPVVQAIVKKDEIEKSPEKPKKE